MAADLADSKDPFQADVGQLDAFSKPWAQNTLQDELRSIELRRLVIRQLNNLRTMDSADFGLIARPG